MPEPNVVPKDQSPFTAHPQDRPVLRSTSRIVVVDAVHYIPASADAFTLESKFACELDTDEQVYLRLNRPATEEWSRIELGWVPRPRMLLLVNEEGRHLRANPSEDERRALAEKVLEVVLSNGPILVLEGIGPWLVHPGESMRGEPDGDLFVRSRSGVTRYTVAALPR